MHQLTFIIQTSCVKTKNYYFLNRIKIFDTNNSGAITVQHINIYIKKVYYKMYKLAELKFRAYALLNCKTSSK